MQWLLAHFRRHYPKRGRGSHLPGGLGTALARGAASLSAVVYSFRRNLPRHRRGSRLAGGLVPHCLEELYSSLRLCTLSAGTDQSIVGGSCLAGCLGATLPRGAARLSAAVYLSAGTDQVAVGDPVWQEAFVQHCLEEPQCSLQLFTLSAGINQGIVH